MHPEEIEDLVERYKTGDVTPGERALVESWYLNYNPAKHVIHPAQLENDQKESIHQLLGQIKAKSSKRYLPRLSIAASILIFLTGGLYLAISKKQPVQYLAINQAMRQDIAPGGNRAILTLSNGSTIILNGAKNGTLATQQNILISKTSSGQISYANSKNRSLPKSLLYNTATTPRGGQFKVVLSDGTKVWLNSASSIKYPVVFGDGERKVELNGEAYFEVTHNAKKPFRVLSNNQVVEVLGTHFNVNAYSDENTVNTTLLQGSVKIVSPMGSKIIKPGEQAQVKDGGINIVNVDTEEVVAWKNGFFYFDDNDLKEVMRQLARWYDVEIRVEGKLPGRRFSGEISRNVKASQILDILSFKKIHYKIEGKSIIVTP